MGATYIHERRDGVKIEYRRAANSGNGFLRIENRELRNDGFPFDDRWWPIDAEELLWIQLQGSDVIELLAIEQEEAFGMPPELP